MPDVFSKSKRSEVMSRIRSRGSEFLKVEVVVTAEASGGRDGTTGSEQRFEMELGSLLETQVGFAPVASVRVAAGQQGGFGNPNPVFILTDLNFRERNNHNGQKVIRSTPDVKGGWLIDA